VTERVCPRCGTAAGDNDYCSKCGFHLAEEAELPTKGQWEARQAEQEASGGAASATSPSGEPAVPAGEGVAESDTAQRAGGARSRGVRERWIALGTTGKRSIASGTAIVVVVVIVLVATSGGGSSPASLSNTGNTGSSSTGNSGSSSLLSAAQTCAAEWNSESSQQDRALPSTNSQGGRVAIGFSAADPSLCTVTFDSAQGFFVQFNQEPGGIFTQGAEGPDAELPGDMQWNATVSSTGTVTAGTTGSGTSSNTGSTGTRSTANTGAGNTGNTGAGSTSRAYYGPDCGQPSLGAEGYGMCQRTSGESCPAGFVPKTASDGTDYCLNQQ